MRQGRREEGCREQAGCEEGQEGGQEAADTCEAAVRRPPRRRPRCRRVPSASMRRGASPAPRRCRSTAPAWQVMRLSRNRNWGHPVSSACLEALGASVPKINGWPGLLVGDISQPRGGPMLTGHASHQVGLDADIWLDADAGSPVDEVRARGALRHLDARRRRPRVDRSAGVDSAHVRILKRTASYKEVERVLVHPAIKKAVCDATGSDKDRGWLSKIRAYWGPTTTSTSASGARRAAPVANASLRSAATTAAGRSSRAGSRRSRRHRGRWRRACRARRGGRSRSISSLRSAAPFSTAGLRRLTTAKGAANPPRSRPRPSRPRRRRQPPNRARPGAHGPHGEAPVRRSSPAAVVSVHCAARGPASCSCRKSRIGIPTAGGIGMRRGHRQGL